MNLDLNELENVADGLELLIASLRKSSTGATGPQWTYYMEKAQIAEETRKKVLDRIERVSDWATD